MSHNKTWVRRALSLALAVALFFGGLPGSVAAASKEPEWPRLKPGTYKIDANLILPAKDSPMKQNIFGTNPDNPFGVLDGNPEDQVKRVPPFNPVKENATAVVGDDGKLKLTVPLPNPVFTIQGLSGAPEGVTIDEVHHFKGPDAPYKPRGEGEGCPTRVNYVKLTIDRPGTTFEDQKGYAYEFSEGSVYAAPLDLRIKKPMVLVVNVDQIPRLPAEPEKVKVPGAAALTYEGKEQTAYTETEGYTVEGTAKAKDAGTYQVTLKLKKDHVWSDGKDDPKTVEWTIRKAKLTAKFVSENIKDGEMPKGKIKVSGFVAGENEGTASGYEAPEVEIPQRLEAGHTYTVTPFGGHAANYEFIYESGVISVGKTIVAVPKALKAPVYNGGEQVGVEAGEHYTLKDAAATEVGSYTAVATLKPDCVWDDGSTADKKIRWNIKPATLTATLMDETVTFGEKPELHVNVTGFVNGETPKTIADYLAPVVKLPKLENKDAVYTLTPAGGEAKGYTFVYEAGKLTVKKKAEAPTPQPPTPQPPKPQPPKPQPPKPGKHEVTQLKEGTYTVSANIWFDKSVVGLPMSPHLTNPEFPPMNPVQDNAMLKVDKNGEATLIVPIVIQDKIMKILDIKGMKIASEKRKADGGYREVTFDLGVLTNPKESIEKNLTVKLELGDLPQSLTGKAKDQTWPAKFLLGLNGVPTVKVEKTEEVLEPIELQEDRVTVNIDNKDVLKSLKNRKLFLQVEDVDAAKHMSKDDQEANKDKLLQMYDIKIVDHNGVNVPDVKATVHINAGKEYAGRNVTVWYSDGQRLTKEILKTAVGADGIVTFEAEHFSFYMLAIEKIKNAKVDPTQPPKDKDQKKEDKQEDKKVEVKRLEPGRYTVSANIWFDRTKVGLPMNPHITSPEFPPKDPVAGNATLIVGNDYRARIIIPIKIQSRIMNIKSITGVNIIDSVREGGYLKSITVDLGVINNPHATIHRDVRVALDMGALAMTMSGKSKVQDWPANFDVNLSGVPTTGVMVTVGENGMPLTGAQGHALLWIMLSITGAVAATAVYRRRNRD